MAKDFVYKRRSMEQVQQRASRPSDREGFLQDVVPFYASRDGENEIRILPKLWEGPPDHYGVDVYVHYQVGPAKASVLCPLRHKKGPCPVCDDLDIADKAGDEETVRQLRPTHRIVVLLVDRKDEKAGVQIWAMPSTVDQDIAKISQDRRSGQYYLVESPKEGFDIIFDKKGKLRNTNYDVLPLPRQPTTLHRSFIEEALEKEALIPDLLIWRDHDEIQELYSGGRQAPSSRRGRDDDEPRRRPRDAEEERPRSRASRLAELEDEDETPRRAARSNGRDAPRRRDEVDDDEIPYVDDDDAPRRGRARPADADDEYEVPARRAPARRVVEDDEDEQPVRRTGRRVVDEDAEEVEVRPVRRTSRPAPVEVEEEEEAEAPRRRAPQRNGTSRRALPPEEEEEAVRPQSRAAELRERYSRR